MKTELKAQSYKFRSSTLVEFRRDINIKINIETGIEPDVATSMARPVATLDRLKSDTWSFIKLKLKKCRINFN